MKILVFSDLHDEEAALERLAKIAPDYDHIFICGDITQNSLFCGEVLRAFPNGLIVPGNWDNKLANDLLSASPQWLHGKRVELKEGFNAVGFGFSNMTPFGTYGELSEEEIYSRMGKLQIDAKTLLLLHCPPKHHFDDVRGKHVGSESILRIIEEKKPYAAFFGHIHEHRGMGHIGHTTLVKLPPANEMRACSLSLTNKKIIAEFISL